jgi:hypothetical protein
MLITELGLQKGTAVVTIGLLVEMGSCYLSAQDNLEPQSSTLHLPNSWDYSHKALLPSPHISFILPKPDLEMKGDNIGFPSV